MKITKIGHSCILIEEKNLKILTDPGMFSRLGNNLMDIDVILITHADMDHLDMNSLKMILKNNPKARIITNKSVGELLKKENIQFKTVGDQEKIYENGILIEGFGKKHAQIYPTIEPQDNTGYLVANKLFFPGDAFTIPNRPVEILALVVFSPWCKFSEVIDYAKAIKPKVCFPVHEAILASPDFPNKMFPRFLDPLGIKYEPLTSGMSISV